MRRSRPLCAGFLTGRFMIVRALTRVTLLIRRGRGWLPFRPEAR